MKNKEELVNREFLMEVPHPKGRIFIWTCEDNNVIGGKEKYK